MAGSLASPLLAETPELTFPLDCTLNKDCYIQQHVDRIAGDGARDYQCGVALNDGHKGTDFAILSLEQMQRGVQVLAAAPGTVARLRDGMPDIDATDGMAPNMTDRECGNGIAIAHGNGWETQYCHLRQGSVMVEEGQSVDAGTPIGLVGMSGMATFPHLHLSLRQGDRVIDPFLPDMQADCGTAAVTLWNSDIPYRPGGLISLGVLDRVPEFDEIKAGLQANALPERPGAMVLWGYAFNGAIGDTLRLTLDGPAGSLGSETFTLEKSQPFLFRAWGKRAPSGGFPSGNYKGAITHLRDGRTVDQRGIEFTLR